MLKKQRMVPVQVRLYCDDCGTEMKYDYISTLTLPQKHKHSCPHCKYSDYYAQVYPTFEYKEDEVADTREFDDVLRGS